MKETCPICGKIFICRCNFQIYCSKQCCKNAQKIKYAKRKPNPPPAKTLNQIAKEADACGLSYGKYKLQLKSGKTFEELKAAYEARKAGEGNN